MLEDSLERQTYLAGDRLTIADLSMTCALLPLFQHVVARSKRELYPNVMAWFDGIVAMDEFAKVGTATLTAAGSVPPRPSAWCQTSVGSSAGRGGPGLVGVMANAKPPACCRTGGTQSSQDPSPPVCVCVPRA